MIRKLKPFQVIGRDFLCAREEALLADEMRLGKTDQAVTAALKLKAKKILITCPATVKLHWRDTFLAWGATNLNYQVVYGRKAKIDPSANVIIINYELVIEYEIFKQLQAMRFAVGILDEAHRLKGMQSRRTEAMFIRGGIASRCHYKWCLTGTPVLNRPIELFPMLAAMAPHVIAPYKSRMYYGKHFCGGHWDDRKWIDKGATNRDELRRRLYENFMLRRTKKEVFGELDKKDFQLIPMPAKGAKIKECLAKEFNWDKSDALYQKNLGGGEDIAILRHEIGDYKVDFAIKHIRHLMTQVDKLVVFAYHQSVLERLFGELAQFNPRLYYGKTSSKNKEKARKDFQTDPSVQIFFGQYQAAGEAIELSAASTIFFVESDWVPGNIDQAADRCFNFTDPSPVLVQFLTIEGSLDEHMLRIVIDKKQNIAEIIGDNVSSTLFK